MRRVKSWFSSSLFSIAMIGLNATVFAAPGQLDSSFGERGRVRISIAPTGFDQTVHSLAEQSDGRILMGGYCWAAPYGPRFCLTRVLSDGKPDPSFNAGQVLIDDAIADHRWDSLFKLAVGDAEKVTAFGMCRLPVSPQVTPPKLCIRRFNSDGTRDQAFGIDGSAVFSNINAFDYMYPYRNLDALLLPSGSMVVAGHCPNGLIYDLCVVKVDNYGALDTTFGNLGIKRLSSGVSTWTTGVSARVVTDAVGAIYVASVCADLETQVTHTCVYKLNQNGVLSGAFGVEGRFSLDNAGSITIPTAMLSDSNGRFVFAGLCVVSAHEHVCTHRLRSDGVIDTSFGVGGTTAVKVGDSLTTVAGAHLQRDGRLLLAATCRTSLEPREMCVVRLNVNGDRDEAYGINKVAVADFATDDVAYASVLQSNGRLLVGGTCAEQAQNSFCAVRFRREPGDPAACSLNVDLDTEAFFRGDAALTMRFLLGYTGNALTDGALGANPGRTAQQIEAHLAQLKADGKLDVDGDGEANALTDGLLLLRAMLGLSGDALTQGALGRPSAAFPTLRTSQQILQWIESTHGVACLP